MQFNLENKKVLITGASGGIGTELCKKYLDYGCSIICTATSEDKINKLKNNFGTDQHYYKIDLSNVEEINETTKLILENHKFLDIVVNNAGLTKDNLVLRMNDNQWEEVIKINLNSHFYIIKALLPSMIKNRKGCILGISSVVALTGNPGQSNYTASKSGMISMYKSIALEVAQRNIRLNIIAPGFIQSPMTDKLNDNQVNAILDKVPMKRLGEPKDIASLVIFLSSDEASYITGQTFHVNGGMLMV